jgi:hypothetical protein
MTVTRPGSNAYKDWRDVLVPAGLQHEDRQDRLTEALDQRQQSHGLSAVGRSLSNF